MPRQCATGPQYGAMPDPWSPAVRKYINDGLDDETLGRALGPTQPPKQKGVLVPSYRIHNEAEEYKIRMGINKPAPEKYQKLNKEFSKRVADAYEQMEHNPTNPEVAAAYNALIVESIEQYKDIIANGLEVEFIPIGQPSPYRIPHEAVEDIISNRHMWVYSTRDGHGQGEKLAGNPLLAPTEFIISGQTALANDIFRVVHDYFGHAKDSIGFRAEGEENAFLSHSSMYSDQAQRALATETRGQNSWVNFGPMGEANRTASEEDTVFAEQKIGLLPEELSNPNNPYSDGGFQPASRRNSPEDIKEAQRIVNYVVKNGTIPKDVADWRSERSADKAAREKAGKQKDELVRAAIQVREGKMTVPKFRELVEKYNPIIAITEVPATASLADVVKALNTNKSGTKRILGLPNVNIADGEAVSFRLDIPAYESYDVWINTIRKEKQNYYSNIGVGNNAIFGGKHTAALKVASKKIAKSPFAVINVAWENQNIEQTEQEIARALQDSQQENSTWKQIGFNPNRSGYFYDKATFLPVASASRVLQLGPLVMAQNVQYVPTEEANVKFSPSGGKIVPSSVIKNSRPNYEMQRALNIVPPSEALLEKGTYAKDMVDANNKSITQKENDKYYGRFYHYLQSSVTPEAWQMLVKWSTPTAILWDANTDPNISTNQPAKNFYHAASDIIYLNTSPSLSLISNKPLERDVEQAVVHEFSHFGDKQLGFPSQSEAFIEAFNQDATNLGILVPLDSPFRDASTKVEMDSITREYAIDEAINNFIFYNYMLHHPNEFQKLIDELSNTNSAIETQNIIDVSNFKIPLPPPTGTGLTQTKLEHRVSSNKGQRSKHFESFWKNNRRKPTNDEMIEQVQASHYILQETKTLDDVYLAREKLYEKLTKEHNSLAEKGNYLHGYFDIIDAMTGGRSHTRAYLPGHGIDYYRKMENRYSEVFANIMEAYMNVDPRGLERIQKEFPKLTAATLSIIEANKGRTIPPSNPEFPRDGRWGNQTSRSVM